MRLYWLLLISLLFATTIIHAEEEEELGMESNHAEEPEEESTTTTTRRPRMTTKSPKKTTTKRPAKELKVDEDYPKCHVETGYGNPFYLCERVVDGETKRFAFAVSKKFGLVCGDFIDRKATGMAYRMTLSADTSQLHICGRFIDSKPDGLAHYANFTSEDIWIGSFKNGAPHGFVIEYEVEHGFSARSWYKEGECRSRIFFDASGNEIRRNAYSCEID